MAELSIACPHCGRPNHLHDPAAGTAATPHDGALGICWKCRQISIFVAGPLGLSQRIPTAEELAEITADAGVRQVLAAMAESYTPQQALALSPYAGEEVTGT